MGSGREVTLNLEDRRSVDAVLDRLDTHGVTRRDFIRLAGAGLAVMLAGRKTRAWAAGGSSLLTGNGRLGFLIMTNQLEYDVLMNRAGEQVARELGFSYVGLNGQLNDQIQLNQFNTLVTQGTRAVMVHSPDGGDIREISRIANARKVWMDNVWGTLPWYTPWEAGPYWTLYAQPDEYHVQGECVRVMCEAMGGEGEIVRVLGVPGNTADTIRTRGADAVLRQFPKVRLVGELPGNWNSQDSQKAMQTLLAKYPNIRGCIAQNDDVATGVIAAIRAAGKVPGRDVLVTGADGTALAAQRIKEGTQIATTGNVPAYAAYLLEARLFDVLHGWTPNDGERMLQWKSIILTKKNVDAYLARYVNGSKPPFSATLMSHVLHPGDWDPQFLVYPMDDLEILWGGNKKPAGWKPPEAFVKARESGLFKKVAEEYKAHYRRDVLGPSPA